jgi:zinc protease
VERLRARGFTAAQLDQAVRQLVAGEVALRQTMSGQAARVGAAEVVVGDLGYCRTYFERLCAVEPPDLKRVLRAYLVPAGRTSVSINPASGAPSLARKTREGGGLPDFSESRLPNGARLLLCPDSRLPNLHVRLLVMGGPHYEAPGKRGSTALLATVLAKDTTRRAAAEVASRIESVGGSFQGFSGNSSLGLAAEALVTDADRALEVVADAVLNPAFKPETVALEREAQLAALRRDADEVVVFARKLLRRKFFGDHALALDAQGDEAGVAALAPGDLQGLHRRLFVASNVVLSVAGDFDPRELSAPLKRFLAKLRPGSVSRPDRPRPPQEAGDFVEKRQREQAIAMQAFPAPLLDGDDYYTGEVADELFSGMASHLFERVREQKALAYFVRSARVTGIDAAMFCFFAGTQPGREAEVLAEIDAEIARVQAGAVEAAEIDRCRARLKAARRQSLQANGSRAMQAALNALLGRPVNDWKNYDARIDAVSAGDLARFASAYLRRSLRTQLVVRP